jgi:hypothetical protein
MATVPNLGSTGLADVKYGSVNRVVANAAAVVALLPAYPGEIVLAADTGLRFRALGTTAAAGWGNVTDRMN